MDMRLAISRHIESLEMSLQRHDEVLNDPNHESSCGCSDARIKAQKLIRGEIAFDQRCREELPLRPTASNKEPNSGEPTVGNS